MSLRTPDAIRTLQRKLYGKAKAEPDYRFYLLYDKVWRKDILRHAYDRARANDGAPGVDRMTFERIEAAGVEDWLTRLGEELRTKTYRCRAVRRVMIPKAGGGERPLGIPTIRDRAVQTAAFRSRHVNVPKRVTAAKLVLEPILEADLDPAAYGYRPERSAGQAIQLVLTLLRQGYTDVVDADLSKYFDTIPHQDLMRSLARRVVDPDMLRLVKQSSRSGTFACRDGSLEWLKAPVETTGEDGRKRVEGGKSSKLGVPQGGVISPLIANLYMNRFLKHWRQTGKGKAWKAHIINYADDFVSPADAFRDISPLRGLILSRGHADEALAWTDRMMTKLGLTLNRTKTRLCDARTERFDFLGYSFGLHRFRQTGRRFIGASPSEKSVQRLKDKVGEILTPGNMGRWEEVRDTLNRMMRGWGGYFSPGSHYVTDRALEAHIYDRVRNFIVRRRKLPSRGSSSVRMDKVFGPLGVLRLRHCRREGAIS